VRGDFNSTTDEHRFSKNGLLDFWMGGLLEKPRTAFHPFIHQSINPFLSVSIRVHPWLTNA
jgi:hypothetical protein